MTKQEFAVFTSALKTYYPKETLLPNKQAMELWHKQLEDIPYNLAEIALNNWVVSNKWSPTIAELREEVAKIALGEIKDWSEAWEIVHDAVRYLGSYHVGEALGTFDDLTKKVVGQMGGFISICQSENPSYERTTFKKIYEEEATKLKEQAKTPKKLKELMGWSDDKYELIREKELLEDGRGRDDEE